MIEVAVAYFNATGKRELLDISMRFADCIRREFGTDEGQRRGYPGHQEIELALVKLFEVTGRETYLDLAVYFIRERGALPNYFSQESEQPQSETIFPEFGQYFLFDRDWSYAQSHIHPTEQRQAVGHAVRAVYMYSAMADLAVLREDKELLEACDILYEDIVNRQMYITGAIGAAAEGERFTGPYDLPNNLVYGETCASVGLMMFCRRMNALRPDARYADTMELALYNTVLAGISLTGTEFFYVNPLESDPKTIAVNPSYRHVKPVRQKWFDCSCCPTNITRTVMSIGAYAYACCKDDIYINLYVGSKVDHKGKQLAVETKYPYGNKAIVTVDGGIFKLLLRNPDHAPIVSIEMNGQKIEMIQRNGYVELEHDWHGDIVTIIFDMEPKLIYSSPRVQSNVGKAAVMRGPLVYCAEEIDNTPMLGTYVIPQNTIFRECDSPEGLPSDVIAMEAQVYKYVDEGALYTQVPPAITTARLKLIPYFLWANRGENEMRCYLNTQPLLPEIM